MLYCWIIISAQSINKWLYSTFILMNLKRDGEIHARLVEWNVKVCAKINVTKRQIGNIVQWKLPFSIKKHVVHSLLVQSSVVGTNWFQSHRIFDLLPNSKLANNILNFHRRMKLKQIVILFNHLASFKAWWYCVQVVTLLLFRQVSWNHNRAHSSWKLLNSTQKNVLK